MKFGVLKFGEKCSLHPEPKPRGMDNAGRLSEEPKSLSQVAAKHQATSDWAYWGPKRTNAPKAAPPPVEEGDGPEQRRLSTPPPAGNAPSLVESARDIAAKRMENAVPRPESAPSGRHRFPLGGIPTSKTGVEVPVTPTAAHDPALDTAAAVKSIFDTLKKRACEKAGYDPDEGAQARKLAQMLRLFGSGEGITRANLGATISFAGLPPLRVAVADAIFAALDTGKKGIVGYAQAAQCIVGLPVVQPKEEPVNITFDYVRNVLLRRFGTSAAKMVEAFGVADKHKLGELRYGELRRYLELLGITMNDTECARVMEAFDRDRRGLVSLGEFCRAIRGSTLSLGRETLVKQAFSQIDLDGSGEATIDELMKVYDASLHPDVVAGKRTIEAVVKDFVKAWDSNKDGSVTYDEFRDFYTELSATIDEDALFELMMRNCWHLSGGTGASANTSNRRVLVTFRDGSQRVVEMKNDLGYKRGNMLAAIKRLEAQGLTDILRVDGA